MDPRFLPFQIAAGLLLAALVMFLIRWGMSIHRNNSGIRRAFGIVLSLLGAVLGWQIILAGFGA